MKYNGIVKGEFLERPNRFIAYVNINRQKETVHVKNTGRCRELLIPGAEVYLEKSDNPSRKTGYSLITVNKKGRLINMDSQAPNKAVLEWLSDGGLFEDLTLIRPETTYHKSRFDFYIEAAGEKIFMEVKGVTLEKDGITSFPDAPSKRALKHVEELIQAKKEGYGACLLFVIQMEGIICFEPNTRNQPEFTQVLKKAQKEGVRILAYDCKVTSEEIRLNRPVPVRLNGTCF